MKTLNNPLFSKMLSKTISNAGSEAQFDGQLQLRQHNWLSEKVQKIQKDHPIRPFEAR